MATTFDTGSDWGGPRLDPIIRNGKKAVIFAVRKICKLVAKFGEGTISAAILTPEGRVAFVALEVACNAFRALDDSGKI